MHPSALRAIGEIVFPGKFFGTICGTNLSKERPRVEDAVARPDDVVPPISKVSNELSPAVKGDVDALFADAPKDVKSGKWSDKTRDEWKNLFKDLKASGADSDEIFDSLNDVGAGLDEVLNMRHIENHVGIARTPTKDGQNISMLINDPGINFAQNSIDAITGHESDRVVKAGETKPGQPI